MKRKTITSLGMLAALVCVGAFGLASCDDSGAPPDKTQGKKGAAKKFVLPEPLGKVVPGEWSQPEQLQATLGPKILKGVEAAGGATPSGVEQFLKKPENRLMLAQWMLAQTIKGSQNGIEKKIQGDADNLKNKQNALKDFQAKLPKEKSKYTHNQKYTLKELKYNLREAEGECATPQTLQALQEHKQGKAILKYACNDPDWLEQIVFSGENPNPVRTLGLLALIAQRHPDYIEKPMTRDIATATALEFSRYNWNADRAEKRYEYFSKHWRNGDLNAVFDTIPFWERRMVCGAKGDNNFCSRESFEWALANVKLPQEQYPGCCWRCGYKLRNPYGDSVHGSLYVGPFGDVYGRNMLQFTREVGGVCGGLSHFGAYSACANGIPAFTAGEPGHCAFVILIGDRWTPAYTLSWERGMHWQVFTNVRVFSSLHMATDLFKPENASATSRSNALRVIAGEYARAEKVAEAKAAYEQAVSLQPCNYYAWREYAGFLRAKAPQDAAAWRKYNTLACEKLAPVYPEMAAVILADAYGPLKTAFGADADGLHREMMRFWESVRGMGPDRWRIEQHITKQLQTLGIGERDAAKVIPFARSLVSAMKQSPAHLPVAFSWVNGISGKLAKEADRTKLLKACCESLAGMQGANENQLVSILTPLILASERMKDMSTFQALRKMLPENFGAKRGANIPKFNPFPGQLTSQGGLVWISSTCQHDVPSEHGFVLEPGGGRWHSGNEAKPWIAVQLTKQTNVSGIVVVLTQGNMQRCHDIKVQISETGKDDDWHDVGVFPKPGRVIRVDLQGKNPLAKYVRVMRVNGSPQFFHLNGIYVYGKPAA